MPDKLAAKAALEAKIESKNIAADLDQSTLVAIGSQCVVEYDIDNKSREKWLKQYDQAQKLVDLTLELKNTPRPNSSNIKYPLVAEAAIQFSSRALPNIVKSEGIVKGKVTGRDDGGVKADRACRIGEHMSYQIYEQMDSWEEEMDRLLVVIAITGCEFKKTYQDRVGNRPESRYVSGKHLVVNNKVKYLDKAPRVTEEIWLYPHEVQERIRSGYYIDQEYTPEQSNGNDTDAQTMFLEQHRRWDLDADGYREPYIVTVHKDTQRVARISAGYDTDGIHIDSRGKVVRVDQVQYYTKYGFMPSFDNTFYDIGYGALLCAANEGVNTTMNQLFDAGTDQNTGGGIISNEINIRGARSGGQVEFGFGEFKYTDGDGVEDFRKKIWVRPTAQPSAVLLNLLQYLVGNYEKFASYTNALAGGQMPANTPFSLYAAQVNEGLSTFKAIYKRIYRGLKAEFKKIYRLNRLYLPDEEYYRVMDSEKAIARADYDDKDCDIVPVSDPESLTDIQKTMKAELLITLTGKGLNDQAIYRRYMTYAGVENIDELFPDPNSEPQPTPEQRMADIEQERLAMEQAESKARIDQIEANVAKILAEADNLGAQGKIAEYEQRIKDMEAHIYVLTQRGADNGGGTEPAAVGGMVGASGNTSVLPEGGEAIAGGAGAPGPGY